jgi:hypothetical protein|tara:strand:+ start:273 stop:404 length:132 start_codon:yes stop_codon:yes gene_type:complete
LVSERLLKVLRENAPSIGLDFQVRAGLGMLSQVKKCGFRVIER